jgi:hypothetical protein
MANYLGTHIAKFDATPADVVDGRLHGGSSLEYKDAFEEIDNANGDTRMVFRVPVNLVPSSLLFACDALGAGTVHIGLYQKDNGGNYVAVDDDCFATAIAVTGAVAQTEVLFEAAATNISRTNDPLWKWAGLTAAPAYGDFYLGLTYATGTSAAGTVRVVLRGTV